MFDDWVKRTKWNELKPCWKTSGKYLLVIVVCLGFIAVTWPQNERMPTSDAQTVAGPISEGVSEAKIRLTNELQAILSQVNGAGQVNISLTLSSDGVKSYARNTKDERRETLESDQSGGDRTIKEDNQSSDIAVSSGSALLIEDNAPTVVGVLIVADGAYNARVKEDLTAAATTLLNIPPHQVRVMARKGGTYHGNN